MSDRIDFEQVREVVRIAAESDLEELEVESSALKVRVRRARGTPPSSQGAGAGVPIRVLDAQAAGDGSAVPAGPPAATGQDHLEAVVAPMVGTFYRAPSPDAPPFVNEGDFVDEGQVVCVIEAMKLFNEIQSEKRGRLARVLVESASPVEYGQPLFLLDTAARS
ncbi:MAG: acetyl-CoA carboxylase biotin carboxyl carrier protein [Armatimonadota bacterium]